VRHGSYASAQAHYRMGEKPCDLCRGAHNEYARIYRRYGPLSKDRWLSSRIVDWLVVEEPASLRRIQAGVEGKPESIRRTLYRLAGRGVIVCDPYTRLYTVTREEG
jgi:hypothetical protein